MNVANNIKIALPKTDSTKEFMGLVGEQSQTVDQFLVGTLMSILCWIKWPQNN